jgi:hypothetical protein
VRRASSGEPTTIPAGEVPSGLASPTPSAPSPSAEQTMLAETGIYLVTADDVLVPRGRELPQGRLETQLEELLEQLAVGPSAQELADQLTTALPPEVELDVTEVEQGTVTVDIAGPVEIPSGAEGRLGVGQIVLTATSVPGVAAVRLAREGEPIDAPLPDGELTAQPLTAEDFEAFLTARPAPSPASTTPPPAPPRSTTPTAAPSS